MTIYWAEQAWLGGDIATTGVSIEVDSGSIAAVQRSPDAPEGAVVLAGLTLPGLANAHSHAFHRLLRGRTHRGTGSFWTWRKLMYAVADGLDPDSYHRVARAAFAEMVQAGYTVVGEFHYLHHDPTGAPYADRNAMGEAILAAAADAGIRLTLLDTCYLHGGIGPDGDYVPVEETQLRFSDGTASAWADRVGGLKPGRAQRVGAAIHSVRAVDPGAAGEVAAWAAEHGVPIHAHVSEQPAENDQCLAAHGRTPLQVLDDAGAVTDRFTAIHATHLDDAGVQRLGAAGASACICPTTERDLADGAGRSPALEDAGVTLAVGSDSHAVVDPFEEMRGVEMHARLATGERGHHGPEALLEMGTAGGYRAVGWPDGGTIAPGAPADLTVIRLESVRLAGLTGREVAAGVVFAATAADVDQVIVAGEVVVRDGRHVGIDVAAELAAILA